MHEHAGEGLSLDDLARAAGLSKYHLVRLFHHAVGLPPHQYLLRVRIERARKLIAAGWPVSSVATEVGFADQSHFTRVFRSVLRTTPAAYASCHPERLRGTGSAPSPGSG